MMKFPCEIIAEPYITQLRIAISKQLSENGFSQVQIANLLKISQPVVSGYLKKGIEENKYLDSIDEAKKIGTQIASILSTQGEKGIPEAIEYGCNTCKIMRQGGVVCSYHKDLVPILEDDCTRCHTKSEMIQLQIDREQILKDLRDLYSNLSKHRNFNSIIPEIGLQIVLGSSDMQNRNDIAGFPGRIKKRKTGNPIAEIPTFGSSERSSILLLKMKEYFPSIRAMAGIKTSEWLIDKLSESEVEHIMIEGFDKEYQHKIKELPERGFNFPFVIVDKGSIGFEAISYVLGRVTKELEITLLRLI
ncbi:MAG: thiamine-phosphate synthase family protein [Candidatus Kariarchaeaceae archaeon]|jgi:predicted fused transcriptional regulator/phosphomethylpyrimidine kinase/predicted transcriptional regulator